MLPSDMNLKIRSGTVGYNNKILVSDDNFSLGKNENVNLTTPPRSGAQGPTIKNHKANSLEPTTIESHSNTAQGLTHTPTISHEDEKTALISRWWLYCLVSVSMKVPPLTSSFAIWNIFQ